MKMNNTSDCDSGKSKRTTKAPVAVKMVTVVAVCDVGALISDHFETCCKYIYRDWLLVLSIFMTDWR